MGSANLCKGLTQTDSVRGLGEAGETLLSGLQSAQGPAKISRGRDEKKRQEEGCSPSATFLGKS